ncbi:MAG TPA: hypothetical protein VLB86_03205 [Gaiellaceae bacterium]|nr:hypothetical protein [Gaiellaceae bacterium]
MDARSAHAQLQRAIERRHLPLAMAAARDCPELALGDALALTLLALESNPKLYDALAARWAARWITEKKADLAEGSLVVAALQAIPGTDARAGGFAILAVARRRHERDVVRTLESWLRSPRAA